VPRPDWLERLLAAARANPGFSFFASRMLSAADPSRVDGAGDIFHVSGLFWRDGHGCRDSAAYLRPVEVFSPCAASALYRTRDVRAAGAFDEDFFCYAEDVDLGFRLRLYGHRCLYVPDAVVEHAGSAISGTGSDFSLYHGQRNLVWTYVKNMPGWLFWLYLPLHIALNLYSLALFTARGRWRPVWRAKRDAVRWLRREWGKRMAIQSRRIATPATLRNVMARGFPRKRCRNGCAKRYWKI
jgi:GT2 family glycosyltransferase